MVYNRYEVIFYCDPEDHEKRCASRLEHFAKKNDAFSMAISWIDSAKRESCPVDLVVYDLMARRQTNHRREWTISVRDGETTTFEIILK